ncbi:uncharacterized protein LOC108105093 isoform X2 [Drosophila eugracilis]|uniref:uncharacterized protein LOC108105093 isoform X2 n=1 Tax=Drosophila eugracilis TaxID=29029 RepID=UPI0007E66E12|nr:uncharacterized protein LOC108105093 isoform X2 [Drosophila eugracilis]
MLIEIYDYAAKLLNNMTARGGGGGVGVRNTAGKGQKGGAVETINNETTGRLRGLLSRTLAKVARANPAQHVTNLPVSALLLQALDAADIANGQAIDIDHPTHSPTTASTDILPGLLEQPTTAATFPYPSNATGIPPLAGNSSSDVYLPAGNLSGFIESSTTAASAVMSTLPLPLPIPTSTMATFQAQTVATFIAATGTKNRPTTIVVYPTVSPESIVIPIVSCIFGFPILALIVICCLRRRAKLARERDRRRNYDMQDHAVSLVRFSPIHRLNYRSSRAISLRPERSLSQGFTSLELDTVLEERCSDVEQTQTEMFNPESPMDTTSYKMSFSSS